LSIVWASSLLNIAMFFYLLFLGFHGFLNNFTDFIV
jgi:hypothetical protein